MRGRRALPSALRLVVTAALCSAGLPSLRGGIAESDWRAAVRERVAASGVEVGLAFKDLETGETLSINERLVMHAASTMKVPVMIEIFRQAEQGGLLLDDRLTVRNEFRSVVDGSAFALSAGDDSETELYAREGQGVPIRELVEKMITVSSNLAANLLLMKAGVKAVQETLERLEAGGMRVVRCLEDGKAFEAGLSNTTDAEGLLRVMEAIADGRAAGGDSCRRMAEILSRQAFKENIPAGLPEGVRSANKTGWITKICHDAAIVYPEGRKPYVLIVLTRGFEDRARAAVFIAELSRIVYAHVAGRE
jgi:beta-lactamase class A